MSGKQCNKCGAELQEIVKLGYFEDLEKTNEYIDNFVSQLIICETCFEKDKLEYWLKYKHIIKEKKAKKQITKKYLKLCGHVGNGCITNPPKLCGDCKKIFPNKRCSNNCDGLGELKTLQEYKAGKCKKCQTQKQEQNPSKENSEKPKGMSEAWFP